MAKFAWRWRSGVGTKEEYLGMLMTLLYGIRIKGVRFLVPACVFGIGEKHRKSTTSGRETPGCHAVLAVVI